MATVNNPNDYKTKVLTLGSFGISFATLRDLLLAEGCEKSGTATTTALGFPTTIQKSMSTLPKKVHRRGGLVNVQSGRTMDFFLPVKTNSSELTSSPLAASSWAPKVRSVKFWKLYGESYSQARIVQALEALLLCLPNVPQSPIGGKPVLLADPEYVLAF